MRATPSDVFPLLLPQDADFSCYEGFLSGISGLESRPWLWLRVSNLNAATPGASKASGAGNSDNTIAGKRPLAAARFECGPELAELLEGYEGMLRERFESSSCLVDFLSELKELLERIAAAKGLRQVGASRMHDDNASFGTSSSQHVCSVYALRVHVDHRGVKSAGIACSRGEVQSQ